MKQKMDSVKKAKLIYSIELIVIAVLFLTIGLLELLQVFKINKVVISIFNWATLFGGIWAIADFIWIMVSPKRQKKASKLDKALLLPLGTFLIAYDLIALIGNIDKDANYDYYRYGISCALMYIATIYTFEGIYHWKYPIPGFVEEILEEERKEEEKQKAIEQASAPKIESDIDNQKEISKEKSKEEE